jgi:hypothetical protein
MKLIRAFLLLSLFGVFGVAVAGGQGLVQESIPNWSAPATWTPTRAVGLHTLSNITSPLPFIGVTPCRVADTRGNGFTGAYGPPSLVANATRSFTITGQCGIPASAEAVSFNLGALNVGGGGDLRVFPAGSSVPLVSTLNYSASTPNIANAAIVPLGSGGGVTVQADAVSIDLIIDVNGYYGNPTFSVDCVFLGNSAGNSTSSGQGNVGVGYLALNGVTGGSGNTAIGLNALRFTSTSNNNTAVGVNALELNRVGFDNTALGNSALGANVDGAVNVAIGSGALGAISSGTGNIAVGTSAAATLTSGSNNIHLGNPALSSESNTIRIGTGDGVHTKFFVAGVRGVTTGQANAVPVVIDFGGQLGTVSSSARVKRRIADVGEESSAILKLRPVSFVYRSDTIGIRQYGLIAEEVAAVMPDLVQFSEAGEPEMVNYHFLPPLLLKELQKQQKTIEQQNEIIAGLRGRLAKVEARLPAE